MGSCKTLKNAQTIIYSYFWYLFRTSESSSFANSLSKHAEHGVRSEMSVMKQFIFSNNNHYEL